MSKPKPPIMATEKLYQRPGSPNYRRQKFLDRIEKAFKTPEGRHFRIRIGGRYKKLTTKELTGFIGELKSRGLSV